MNENSLSIEQVRIFAGTLRRHANSTLQEYIASAQGWGTLSATALSARFELFNEVVAEVRKRAPDFAEHIPFFDVAEEVESAFARLRAIANQRRPQPDSLFPYSSGPTPSVITESSTEQ